MIIVGVDYHPSVQQVAFLDAETGEMLTVVSLRPISPPQASNNREPRAQGGLRERHKIIV
jgi:hypothetical protein